MAKGEIQVPEGHKVVVIGPSPRPFLARAESGSWVLDLGDGKDLTRALDAVESFVQRAGKEFVVWIIQAEFLAALGDVATSAPARRTTGRGWLPSL